MPQNVNYQQQYRGGYQQRPPQQAREPAITQPKKRQKENSNSISLVGILIFFICIAVLSLTGLFGFANKKQALADEKKVNDIEQVILALDDFYKNSNVLPEKKSYPVAACSNNYLNSVDFEYILRIALTGSNKKLDTFAYINSNDYPRDKDGSYTTNLTGRDDFFDCLDRLPFEEGYAIYPEGYESCLFNNGKYKNCYLYTSSVTGESYKIAYYSESKGEYVVYEKEKGGQLLVSYTK